jgi:hypothetical protein
MSTHALYKKIALTRKVQNRFQEWGTGLLLLLNVKFRFWIPVCFLHAYTTFNNDHFTKNLV